MFTFDGRRHVLTPNLTPHLATDEILLWRHKVTFRDAIGNEVPTLADALGKTVV